LWIFALLDLGDHLLKLRLGVTVKKRKRNGKENKAQHKHGQSKPG
jgi:hypothetical protein